MNECCALPGKFEADTRGGSTTGIVVSHSLPPILLTLWKAGRTIWSCLGWCKELKIWCFFFLSPPEHSYIRQHGCVCEGCRPGSDAIFWQISHVALSGLRNWTAPVSPKSVMLARQFKAFLPPKNKLDLGDPWWIIPSELNIFTGYLSNNRFYPPPPKGKEVRYEIWFPYIWEVACMNVYCLIAQINWVDKAVALCLLGLSKAAKRLQCTARSTIF